MKHAIVYYKGKLTIRQIETPEKKMVMFDGIVDGKRTFRPPKVGDDIGMCNFIMFIGTEQECKDEIEKKHEIRFKLI